MRRPFTSFDEALARERERPAAQPRHHDNAEHRLQAACVRWFRYQHQDMAHALFAVPNAARRSEKEGAYLKEEGMVPGVADLILLRGNGRYGALCIEMKTPDGRQTATQKHWQEVAERTGNKYAVCRSIDEFVRTVEDYLSGR